VVAAKLRASQPELVANCVCQRFLRQDSTRRLVPGLSPPAPSLRDSSDDMQRSCPPFVVIWYQPAKGLSLPSSFDLVVCRNESKIIYDEQ